MFKNACRGKKYFIFYQGIVSPLKLLTLAIGNSIYDNATSKNTLPSWERAFRQKIFCFDSNCIIIFRRDNHKYPFQKPLK